jgi:tetratricopeptide (TPR) repeat protein
LQQQQAYAAALEYFARALKASPESDSVRVEAAQAYLRLGRAAEAEEVLVQTLARNARVPEAHYLLAQIAEQRENTTRAEEEYRKEIEVNPWEYRARFNLALLLGGRGAHVEQTELLRSIPAIAPGFHEVHFYLATAYLNSGDPAWYEGAIASANMGLRLAPRSPIAPLGHYVLADIYRLQGKQAESQRELDLGRAPERRLGESPGKAELINKHTN